MNQHVFPSIRDNFLSHNRRKGSFGLPIIIMSALVKIARVIPWRDYSCLFTGSIDPGMFLPVLKSEQLVISRTVAQECQDLSQNP